MEKVPYKRPVTKIVEKTFTINRTEMRPITRQRWVTENVPRVIQKPQLKYVIEHIKRRAVRMVTELKAVEKEVPKTIPVPLVEVKNATEEEDTCGCFRSDCDCYGKEGCSCCYPECQCAPSMISPTETEIIITTEECEVPQSYIEEIAVEVPQLYFVNFTINEPRRIQKTETLEEPHLIQVNKTYDWPALSYVDDFRLEPKNHTTTRLVEVPVEMIVMKERKVPVVTMKNFTVEVPVETDHTIVEQRSVMQKVEVEMPIAVQFEEPIPNPPCHWHEIKHTHECVNGLTHTHNHIHPEERVRETVGNELEKVVIEATDDEDLWN